MNTTDHKTPFPIQNKISTIVFMALVPLTCLAVYLLVSFLKYSDAYDDIVSNMSVANSYSLRFKEEMDESLYKLVVGYVSFEDINDDPTLKNPYILISEARSDFGILLRESKDSNSRSELQNLLRTLDTLEDCIDTVHENIQEGNSYDKNIRMLDDDIYILTELIQDDIQSYIFFQTTNIGALKNTLTHQLRIFVSVFIIVLVAVLILIGFFAVIIQRSITNPVSSLYEATTKVASGDFSVRASIDSNDEVALLANSFNHMTEDLEVMVNQISEDERKMRDAEIRLLQEQINPHFLYNTLDTIIWLMEAGSKEKAIDMVMSLSSFFRLVLSGGKDFISIKDEELHITSYLEIQKIRYSDILDFDISIDPSVYDYKILKLTLQPIVENALYHGIKYKRAKGTITVLGYKENDLIKLEVMDDGVGMNEEALAALRDTISKPCKETRKGFGLANVNERIRMNFGVEYGMTIESEEGIGTSVMVTIPAQFFNTKGEIHEDQ